MSLYKDASLVMTPSAYKDGKLYSIRPTDGSGDFTFSRGSNLAATRVDVNGLIEKGRENLLLQSNQFDTTWVNTNTTETGGQSGYDGSSDAWLIDISGGADSQRISQSLSGISGVTTYSVYAKAGTLNWVLLLFGSGGNCYFDLQNGAIGGNSGIIDASIEAVGATGWYRISVTQNYSITTVRMYLANSDGNITQSSGNIYIQDAQLESSMVATDYIETGASTAQAGILEDMPRLDYSGGASCPSLLLEPQRTNLFDHSEYFNVWSNAGTTPVFTNNYGTSPEGLQNSTRVQLDNSDIFYKQIGSSQGAYVFSVFAKAISGGNSQIILRVDIPASIRAVFDLSDGTIVTSTSDGADIIDYGNGWYRCILIQNNDTIVNAVIEEYSDSLDCEMYGAQLESGSYPTSYIPTYGTSQTRSGDAASLVGTDLLDQDNQTLFIEYTKGGVDGSANTIYSTSDGTSSANRMQIVDNNDDVYIYSNAGGTNILNNTNALLLSNLETGDTIKVAVVMTATSIKAFANGVEKVDFTDSFSWSVTMDDLYIGARGGSSEPPKGQGVKQALVFPTALTDSECIALTTL